MRAELTRLMPTLRARYGVQALSLFGSYARGEQTAESDLDLLVTFADTPGMVRFVELAHFLEDHFGVSVDLATKPMTSGQILPCEIVKQHLLKQN